jgi:hypothetical protein
MLHVKLDFLVVIIKCTDTEEQMRVSHLQTGRFQLTFSPLTFTPLGEQL